MQIHILPEYESLPADREVDMHLLIRLEVAARPGARKRLPMHLALVLDRSGSMEGRKLEHAKDAAVSLMNWLTRNDFLAVVAFDDTVDLLVPHQSLTEKMAVEQEIRSLTSGSSTNLSGGWLEGLRELRQNFTEGHIYRAILLTDGEANAGVLDPDKLREIALRHHESRITTTTVGFGDDFNEDILHGIADSGGGHFYYVDKPEALANAFQKEFGGLTALVGQNLKLILKTAPGVTITEVLGDCPGEINRTETTTRFGDVRVDDLKQHIVKLRIPAGFAGNKAAVVTVSVQYDSLTGEMLPFAQEHSVCLDFAGLSEPDGEVRREVWMAAGMRLRLEAMEAIDSPGNIPGIVRRLREHAENIEDIPSPTQRLRREQTRLLDLATQLDSRQDDYGALRKQMAQDRLTASRRSDAHIAGIEEVEAEFTPETAERVLDVQAGLERLMLSAGYEQAHLERAGLILKELADNALEHGCADRPGVKARVVCYVAPYYVKIVVEDDGPGFDFEATIARLRNEVLDPNKRGRGLVLVERATDHLRHSDKGRHIEAILRRMGLSANVRVPGVGECNYVGDIAVVKVQGAIDSHTFETVDELLGDLIDKGWIRLVVDLSEVDYMSSAGAGVFIGLQNTLTEYEGAFAIASPTPSVREVLDLLGLSSIFYIADNAKDAIEYLS